MAIKVVSGINVLTSKSLTDRTVASVRETLRQPLNIDPASHPLVNGEMVSEDHTLKEGDELEFLRAGGKKGATVTKRDGMKLMIWPNDHQPPHFHADYQGENASFRIADCARLSKGLERREAKIKELWRKEQSRLSEQWSRLRPSG